MEARARKPHETPDGTRQSGALRTGTTQKREKQTPLSSVECRVICQKYTQTLPVRR